MFLGSCPFCSLAFASAGEVVWHVHDEHHWLTEEEQLNVEVVQAVSDELNWANFSELQSTVDDVAISLLVPTTPGARETSLGSTCLARVAKTAYDRMAQKLHPAAIWKVMPRLGAALAVIEHGPKDEGLAMFVSTKRIAVFWLPFAPRARASVSDKFAVRDLLDALQQFPRYRALVIGGRRPRILEGWAGHLHEVDCAYPELACSGLDAAKALLADRVSRTTEFPLVVIGPGRFLEIWRERSRPPSLLIGTVQSDRPDVSADHVAKMAQPLVTLWREAVATVETAALGYAERAGLVKWGLRPAWSALVDGSAERIWVRRDFASAAVRTGADWQLQADAGGGRRDHTDDIVEEVLRAARRVDATVSFVGRAALPSGELIGAQLATTRRDRGGRHRTSVGVVDLSSQAQLT